MTFFWPSWFVPIRITKFIDYSKIDTCIKTRNASKLWYYNYERIPTYVVSWFAPLMSSRIRLRLVGSVYITVSFVWKVMQQPSDPTDVERLPITMHRLKALPPWTRPMCYCTAFISLRPEYILVESLESISWMIQKLKFQKS